MKKNGRQNNIRIWAVLVWLALWQAASMALGKEILLVSPVRVLFRLKDMMITPEFWSSIGFSFLRIAGGFLLSVIIGSLLAALASKYIRVRELLAPLVITIRSVPVASFIILALIWFSSKSLSILISFLMVFPVIYTNVLDGIQAADPQLVEMGKVFRMKPARLVRYIYIPEVFPFFYAGCTVSSGLCWKAGIAAEVIGMPVGSIGEKLQQAKVYLDTPDLFSWTLVIVVISVLFEKLFLKLIRDAEARLEAV
jgi:NitT/TauT family transport system permease protein